MGKVNNKSQQGFIVVELVIFVVIVIAVAGIGYWALNKSKAASAYSPDIAAITPDSGPAGTTKLKFSPKTNFAGHYRLDIKKVGSSVWISNVVRLIASADHQSLTNDDGSLWTFPTYVCSRDGEDVIDPLCKTAAELNDTQSIYAVIPDSKWYLRLTDLNNPTSQAIVGNANVFFRVTTVATPQTITSNIDSIEPTSGPVGKLVKVFAPNNTIYSGTYQVNVKLVESSFWRMNVAETTTANVAGNNWLVFDFPKYPCPTGLPIEQLTLCRQPNSELGVALNSIWNISLTRVTTNPASSSPTTGNGDRTYKVTYIVP